MASPSSISFALAAAVALAGCVGAAPTAPGGAPVPPDGDAWAYASPKSAGAAWLRFPEGAHGNLTLLARQVERFPFAVEATWLSAEGLEPLFYAYEMNFRHQEGVVAAGAGPVREESARLAPVMAPFDLPLKLPLDKDGPGWLAVAWGALPRGVELRGGSLEEGPAETLETDATFLDLVVNGTAFAYTPAAQAVQHAGGGEGAALLNLRLILPNNGGQGEVSFQTPHWEWQKAVGPPPVDPSCVNCHRFERHLGVASGPWSFSLRYGGVSANFQAYLMAALLPPGDGLPQPAAFLQFPDCATSQSGC